MEYQGSRNAFDILPFLLQKKLRVVNIFLFSGSTPEILTPLFPSLAPKGGLKISEISWKCPSEESGDNGGSQENTREKIKWEASSGN